jgi:type I restriction enzyme S subunit
MTLEPYKLPDGWRWETLGTICQINPRRPRLSRDENAPTTFVPMSAVDEESGTIATSEVRLSNEVRKGYTYFEEGDVLFAKITPCMENGKAAIARELLDGIGFGSTEFHVLRPNGQTTAEWIWLFVRQERFRAIAKASFRGGVGQQRVPQELLEHHLIPVAPIPVQRRIAARIEELMDRVREARRLREHAQADAGRLMQAALAEVFPRPGAEPPEGWRWARLGDVASEVVSGFAFGKKVVENGDLLHLRPYNIGLDGALDLTQTLEVPREAATKKVSRLLPGDVLFNNTNSVELVGKTAVVEESLNAGFSNHLTMIRTNPNLCEGAWLARALMAQWQQGVFERLCNKWIGQAGLNTAAIKEIRVPLTSVAEQRCIVAYLDAVQQKATALKQAQSAMGAELRRLEQAILDKAFRGEL